MLSSHAYYSKLQKCNISYTMNNSLSSQPFWSNYIDGDFKKSTAVKGLKTLKISRFFFKGPWFFKNMVAFPLVFGKSIMYLHGKYSHDFDAKEMRFEWYVHF